MDRKQIKNILNVSRIIVFLILLLCIFNINKSYVYADDGIRYVTTNNADRTLLKGGKMSNGEQSLQCGVPIHINNTKTDCYEENGKNWCKFDEVAGLKISGVVDRDKLSDQPNSVEHYCENRNDIETYYTRTINKIMYLGFYTDYIDEFGKYHGAEESGCGYAVFVSYCYYYMTEDEEHCFISYNTNEINEERQFRGTVAYDGGDRLYNNPSEAYQKCASYDEIKSGQTKFDIDQNVDYSKPRYAEESAYISGAGYSCGDELWLSYCNDTVCYYHSVNDIHYGSMQQGVVNRSMLKTSRDEVKCNLKSYVRDTGSLAGLSSKILEKTTTRQNTTTKQNNTTSTTKKNDKEVSKKCIDDKNSNLMGSGTFFVCYKDGEDNSSIEKMVDKNVTCANGYDKKTITITNENEISFENNKYGRTYKVSCDKEDGSTEKNVKPILSVSSGLVTSDGTGTISISAKASNGNIVKYYVSELYEAPTQTTKGWISTNTDSFSVTSTPGIKYFWVMDSYGNISNAVGGGVYDTTNSDTTVKTLKLSDYSGNVDIVGANDYYDGISTYKLLSNDLISDNKLADGFNPYTSEYKVNVKSPTLTVTSTLTSSDSKFVSGYGPRTVNLKYGMNTILIKIENNKGKIRTYTILVNREDDRKSDNTLNDIKLSVGKIEFNSNVTDYKIEIDKNVSSVNVEASINSELAKYVTGYTPGEVKIDGDITTKLIKVQSEYKTTRTYVLTFIKKGKDRITNRDLQLMDFKISDGYVPFESEIANYSLSVGYDVSLIDINFGINGESTYEIRYKNKDDGTWIKTEETTGIKLDVGENYLEIKIRSKDGEEATYRFTIIRKEYGLEVDNDTSLKELKILNHKFNFNPKQKEYKVKIKKEKSLIITAVPTSNRAEVVILGNNELTAFSTVRLKVIAENGEYTVYSIDIKKDIFNKTLEIGSIVVGMLIIICSMIIIMNKRKRRERREYLDE